MYCLISCLLFYFRPHLLFSTYRLLLKLDQKKPIDLTAYRSFSNLYHLKFLAMVTLSCFFCFLRMFQSDCLLALHAFFSRRNLAKYPWIYRFVFLPQGEKWFTTITALLNLWDRALNSLRFCSRSCKNSLKRLIIFRACLIFISDCFLGYKLRALLTINKAFVLTNECFSAFCRVRESVPKACFTLVAVIAVAWD